MPDAPQGSGSSVFAFLSVGGLALPEFKPTTSGTTTGVFVESTPRQEWKLSYGTKGDPGVDIHVKVMVDGKQVDTAHVRKGRAHKLKHCEGTLSADRTTVSPFVFTRLQVGDSDDEGALTTDEHVVKALGEIRVVFTRGVLGPSVLAIQRTTGKAAATTSQVKVHEKVKKAASETTTFGDSRARKAPRHTAGFVSRETRPFQEIVFLYRSATLLELREGIEVKPPTTPFPSYLPPPSSKSSKSSKRKLALPPQLPRPPPVRAFDPNAAMEELNDLQTEIGAVASGCGSDERVKKEKDDKSRASGNAGTIVLELSDDEEDGARKKVKREKVVKKEKGPPVVIDLTFD